jgi:polysaccharide export outer membrane protein
MRRINVGFAVLAWLICVGIGIGQSNGTPSDQNSMNPSERGERYRIGFQDVLEVQVFKHPNLSQRVPVGANGSILLFRLDKPVTAVCKTERELADDIASAYKEKFIRDPQVTVVVAERKSQSFAVLGAVEKPGNFFVDRKIHLLEMLALAGGPNKEAGTRLLVARTGSSTNCKEGAARDEPDVSVLDYKIRDVQEGKQIVWMKPGDVVTVLDADIVYMYGNVNKQGSYKIREPITLTQAIVSAEGLKPTAKKDKIRILRQRQGSAEREEFVFDLNQIDKGKVRDPFLEPNDIVAVSEDRTKSILLGFANSLKSSVPNVLYRFP